MLIWWAWCSWESCSFSVKICKCLSFCRNTGPITWFCSVRDFMISVLLIFLFLDSQLFFQRVYNWYIVSIYCQFFLFKSSDLFIVVNSSSMRDFFCIFSRRIRSSRKRSWRNLTSTNLLLTESNFKFSTIRFFVRRIPRVSSTLASSQFVAEDLFMYVSKRSVVGFFQWRFWYD